MSIDTVKRNRTIQKWKDKNRDRINILFPKGTKERVQAAADAAGVSKSTWILDAINEKLEREN